MSVTEVCESPEALSSLESLGDAVIVTGLSGTVQFLNAAAKRLVAVGDQSVAGRPLNELLHLEEESTGSPIDNLVEFALVSGCSVSLGRDLVLVLASGQTIRVEGEVAVRRVEGRPAGAVVTLRDITARSREDLQRRERQQMQAIGQLAGSVAHEVNNLLTVVVGHSEILERRELPPPSSANVAAIRHAADGIASVTRQLLSLSGREVLLPTIVSLNTLLTAVEGELRSAVPANITLVLSMAESLDTVLVDQWKMEQAIVDLVRFSAGRMASGGTLTIATRNIIADANARARHSRPFVELAVQDEGPPIRGTAAEELFEPSVSITPGRPFTLGLFTVRNLVSASGGHLCLENGATAGARIVVLLPRFQDESELSGDSVAPPPTILLVEDDDAIRILLSNSLEAKGYRVLEARDGEEALVHADLCDDPIQLVITDVVMPRMDGPALARRLAATRPSTKVLLISGCATDLAAIQQLLDEGAHYFQKPFTQSALLEWIEANV